MINTDILVQPAHFGYFKYQPNEINCKIKYKIQIGQTKEI